MFTVLTPKNCFAYFFWLYFFLFSKYIWILHFKKILFTETTICSNNHGYSDYLILRLIIWQFENWLKKAPMKVVSRESAKDHTHSVSIIDGLERTVLLLVYKMTISYFVYIVYFINSFRIYPHLLVYPSEFIYKMSLFYEWLFYFYIYICKKLIKHSF